ncbi:MAG TPA: hypothetical protein VF297_32435 [Pyrinomonadaceae bacterium]
MIYVLCIDAPDGGNLLRIVSDEPGSFSHRHVKLSFRAYVSPDLRSFDVTTRTWHIAPEAREEFGQWVYYIATVCGAYFSVRDLPGDPRHFSAYTRGRGVAGLYPYV